VIENAMDDFEKIARLRRGTIRFVATQVFGSSQALALSPTSQTYIITGQAPTPWKSKTVFQVNANRFEIESDTGKVILNYNFISGDVLEVDYEKRRVLRNGVRLDIAIDMETRWFELKPGRIELKASHETEVSYSE